MIHGKLWCDDYSIVRRRKIKTKNTPSELKLWVRIEGNGSKASANDRNPVFR